jgi:hypothetical protein
VYRTADGLMLIGAGVRATILTEDVAGTVEATCPRCADGRRYWLDAAELRRAFRTGKRSHVLSG